MRPAPILDDVLHYRHEVARLSAMAESEFTPCFRAYRGYLNSCITGIDALLNRRAWYALNDPSASLSAGDRATLGQQAMSLKKKFERWVPILGRGGTISATSKAWVDFDALRVARNGFVHVNKPHFVFALREIPDVLNLCRFGIGQLMLDLMGMFGANPLPNMYAVRYAPEASFVERRPAPSA